jgi:hypothetical protein
VIRVGVLPTKFPIEYRAPAGAAAAAQIEQPTLCGALQVQVHAFTATTAWQYQQHDYDESGIVFSQAYQYYHSEIKPCGFII